MKIYNPAGYFFINQRHFKNNILRNAGFVSYQPQKQYRGRIFWKKKYFLPGICRRQSNKSIMSLR